MQDHELRLTINDELHGRPGLPVHAPARITHMAFTIEQGDADPLLAVKQLCETIGVKTPLDGAPHHGVDVPGGLIKYERHGEFYRLSVVANRPVGNAEAVSQLPLGWLDTLPGKRLVAIHTHILPKSAKVPSEARIRKFFGDFEVACSHTNQKQAMVWSDFRIGADGYSRMLILDRGMSSMRMGRLTRRLHEIETYRMMALLTVPMARQLQSALGPLEKSLAETVDSMLAERAAHEDAESLAQLSVIARNVEDISNRSSFRFAAARAYSDLVSKRCIELGEERVLNYQRLGVFLDRRFSPAMTTCRAVTERIADLARRCERASNLLRTRVDIALQGQNQMLLRSMEQRARQQLMLQETVEGLSVAAISYYVIGIVSKLIEGLGNYLPAVPGKKAELIAIPIVIALVWYGVRGLRKRVLSQTSH